MCSWRKAKSILDLCIRIYPVRDLSETNNINYKSTSCIWCVILCVYSENNLLKNFIFPPIKIFFISSFGFLVHWYTTLDGPWSYSRKPLWWKGIFSGFVLIKDCWWEVLDRSLFTNLISCQFFPRSMCGLLECLQLKWPRHVSLIFPFVPVSNNCKSYRLCCFTIFVANFIDTWIWFPGTSSKSSCSSYESKFTDFNKWLC